MDQASPLTAIDPNHRPSRSAYQVIHELGWAHRGLKQAEAVIEKAQSRYKEAELDALKVFEANGWPEAVRDGKTIIRLDRDHDQSPYLVVEDDEAIPSVYGLKSPFDSTPEPEAELAIPSAAGVAS